MVTQQQLMELINLLNQGSWIKTYLPLITTFVGLIFGFFLNVFKDFFVNKKDKLRYQKIVKDEVLLAIDDVIDLGRRICKELDENERTNKVPFVYFSRVSDVSYREYYPKIIDAYSTDERRWLHSIYSNIEFVNSFVGKSGTSKAERELNINPGKLNDVMIAIFTIYRCYGNLYCGMNRKTISIGAFLKETKIDSEFYWGLIKKAAKESKISNE